MASGVNKVLFEGYLGADPKRKEVGDSSVVNIRIGCPESWVDKEGNKQKRTEWMDADFWGKRGETLMKFFKKGDPIRVEGKLSTRSWEDNDGNKRYKTFIKGLDWGWPLSKRDRSSNDEGGSDDESF